MCEETPTSSLEFSFVTELLLDAFSNLRKDIKNLNTTWIWDLSWWTELFRFLSIWAAAKKGDNLLVFFEVSEANKGQLISHKGLRSGECLYIAFVVFDLVKIAGVYVAAELWDHRGNRCHRRGGRGERQKERWQNHQVVQLLSKGLVWVLFKPHKKFLIGAIVQLLTLTVSDGVKGPLVVFEERVLLDLLNTIST